MKYSPRTYRDGKIPAFIEDAVELATTKEASLDDTVEFTLPPAPVSLVSRILSFLTKELW